MAVFRAEVLLDFEAESLETAGRELRRLEVAAREVGFEFRTARVEPWPREESDSSSSGWTAYGPLDSSGDVPRAEEAVRHSSRMRSTRPQKLIAVAILILALLLLTPLAELAVGLALFGVAAWVVIRFYPRRSA